MVLSQFLSPHIPGGVALAIGGAAAVLWLVVVQRLWRFSPPGVASGLLAASFVTTAVASLIGIWPFALRPFGNLPYVVYGTAMWAPLVGMALGPVLLGAGLLASRLMPAWVGVLAVIWGVAKALSMTVPIPLSQVSMLLPAGFAVTLGLVLLLRTAGSAEPDHQCV